MIQTYNGFIPILIRTDNRQAMQKDTVILSAEQVAQLVATIKAKPLRESMELAALYNAYREQHSEINTVLDNAFHQADEKLNQVRQQRQTVMNNTDISVDEQNRRIIHLSNKMHSVVETFRALLLSADHQIESDLVPGVHETVYVIEPAAQPAEYLLLPLPQYVPSDANMPSQQNVHSVATNQQSFFQLTQPRVPTPRLNDNWHNRSIQSGITCSRSKGASPLVKAVVAATIITGVAGLILCCSSPLLLFLCLPGMAMTALTIAVCAAAVGCSVRSSRHTAERANDHYTLV